MNLLKTFSQIIFPPTCPLCRTPVTHEATLCTHCWPKINFIEPPHCNRCGCPQPMGEIAESPTCYTCLHTPPIYQKNRSVLVYTHASKAMVLSFKHGEQFHMGPFLAALMVQKGKNLLLNTDLIIPIPLHWTRLAKRGFNQSGELAKHISRTTRIAYDLRSLKRIKATPTQDGLTKLERQENLKNAFVVCHPESIQGKRILLIDDVITTGATLNHAATALLNQGAICVNTLTLAWVPPTHKNTG